MKPGEHKTVQARSFCAIPEVLAFLNNYIVFAEKDEDRKYV